MPYRDITRLVIFVALRPSGTTRSRQSDTVPTDPTTLLCGVYILCMALLFELSSKKNKTVQDVYCRSMPESLTPESGITGTRTASPFAFL
jgi:hypothetical protein